MGKSAIDKRLMPGYGEGYSDGIREGSEVGIKIAQETHVNSVRPIHMTCPQNHCPIHKQIKAAVIAQVREWAEQTEEMASWACDTDDWGVKTIDLNRKLNSMEADNE